MEDTDLVGGDINLVLTDVKHQPSEDIACCGASCAASSVLVQGLQLRPAHGQVLHQGRLSVHGQDAGRPGQSPRPTCRCGGPGRRGRRLSRFAGTRRSKAVTRSYRTASQHRLPLATQNPEEAKLGAEYNAWGYEVQDLVGQGMGAAQSGYRLPAALPAAGEVRRASPSTRCSRAANCTAGYGRTTRAIRARWRCRTTASPMRTRGCMCHGHQRHPPRAQQVGWRRLAARLCIAEPQPSCDGMAVLTGFEPRPSPEQARDLRPDKPLLSPLSYRTGRQPAALTPWACPCDRCAASPAATRHRAAADRPPPRATARRARAARRVRRA